MPEALEHRIKVHLDELLLARGMTLVELSARVGVTVANLSILKNGHARALRFSTLTAICDAVGCTPGELLGLQDHQAPHPASLDLSVCATPEEQPLGLTSRGHATKSLSALDHRATFRPIRADCP